MAIDKGIIRRALLRARRLNKKRGSFNTSELGVYSGGLKRMIDYGIIEKAAEGDGYRLKDPKANPLLLYKQASYRGKHRKKIVAQNKDMSSFSSSQRAQRVGPSVRVTPWSDEGTYLIQIGKRNYLAHEVMLTIAKHRSRRKVNADGETTE